jgi:hypothetical protein
MSTQSLDIVYRAIDKLNAQSNSGDAIVKAPITKIYDGDNGIDSLDFVNLIVAVEEEICGQTGKPIILIDEKVMNAAVNPFETVKALADYLDTLVFND